LGEWELVLVDDGSTDATSSVIDSAIARESRQRLIRQQNAGVCAARNAGYAAASASSDYVYFPDPDDVLEPTLLETMVAYMDARPEVGLAYCGYTHIDEDDRRLATPRWHRYEPMSLGVRVIPDDEPRTPFAAIYCWAPIPEPVAFMRRAVYERTTGWDESFGQHGEGVVLFPQFALLSEVHFVNLPLYRYRVRRGQSSRVAGRQETAEAKVVAWWQNATWLTPEQRAVVRHAEWFRYYRLDPWKGLRTAAQDLGQGRCGRAARFLLGAGRRYAQSFVRVPHSAGKAT
jgi:glycosyltransferase involved in cell wall biosynthesis